MISSLQLLPGSIDPFLILTWEGSAKAVFYNMAYSPQLEKWGTA